MISRELALTGHHVRCNARQANPPHPLSVSESDMTRSSTFLAVSMQIKAGCVRWGSGPLSATPTAAADSCPLAFKDQALKVAQNFRTFEAKKPFKPDLKRFKSLKIVA
jgi:hypothetical protein